MLRIKIYTEIYFTPNQMNEEIEMQFITFLSEFIKHPKNTGAIAPSSNILAKAMVDAIDFDVAKCIVELGPGTGSFTKEIMKRKRKEQHLF